ncbi:glutathione S-transferase-like protein [Gymnopus androsaceus JB14]|uniref:glutathione transferase n=1 Tax=Gymnopus androsaceus JB14 TaxID=1447944 RepID=A0A6A4GS61_9AGAR|nr:glutathione S-transferase-like protein [Gymnopus androsaceus JB14]
MTSPSPSSSLFKLLSPSVQQSSAHVLELFGSLHCVDTTRIQIVLHEKKIPYELVNLDTLSDSKASELMRQPFAHASGPFIEEDGFILCDSRAICRYLATKYADQGAKLIPDAYNIKRAALFEQAVFTEVFAFEPYASKAVYEKVTKRLKGLAPDEAVFEASIAGLSSKLKAYEDLLSRQRYLAGDELTLADIYHIPGGAMLTSAGSNIMTRKGPNITRWWNEISSRPSWIAVQNGDQVQA